MTFVEEIFYLNIVVLLLKIIEFQFQNRNFKTFIKHCSLRKYFHCPNLQITQYRNSIKLLKIFEKRTQKCISSKIFRTFQKNYFGKSVTYLFCHSRTSIRYPLVMIRLCRLELDSLISRDNKEKQVKTPMNDS